MPDRVAILTMYWYAGDSSCLVAMSSLDAIGIIMACWGSNNKYALIGGLRAAAQMISYELPLILALVGVVMQFAWLILIPVTLGNIVLTSVIYLVVSNLGLSNMVFLVVTAIINWALLFGFIRLVSRATVVSTRHAQAPALRAVARRRMSQKSLSEHVEIT